MENFNNVPSTGKFGESIAVVNENFLLAQQKMEELQALYNALQQTEPEIIEPSDTWPVANPEEGVIYRVIDRVNTPPQYYSDFMWNGTSMVQMARYNNAIDDEPTPGSANLVKSGGVAANIVYDISAAHSGTTYADLASALGTNGANVPVAVRKGGMSVKFVQSSVQSSDNKYVQYRLMANEWSTTVSDWQGVDDEPTAGSDNLVKSGGVHKQISDIKGWEQKYSINIPTSSAYSSIVNLSETIYAGSKVRLRIDGYVGKMYFQLLTSDTHDAYPNPQYLVWTGDNYYEVELNADANRYFLHCNMASDITTGGDVEASVTLVNDIFKLKEKVDELETEVSALSPEVEELDEEVDKLVNGYTPSPIPVSLEQTENYAMTPNGTFVDGTAYGVNCDYFAVQNGKKYSVNIPKTPPYGSAYFGLIGFIDNISGTTASVQTIEWTGLSEYSGDVISDRDGYIVICYQTTGGHPSVNYIQDEVPSVYERLDNIEQEIEELKPYKSILYGKKIAYNGDSICESRNDPQQYAYNGGGYAQLIADATGCTFENRAISGGILASAVPEGQTLPVRMVVSDIENMAADADLICIEGGVNDFWKKIPLGVVTDYPHDALTYSGPNPYDTTYDTTTILGALDSIFYQATRRWVGKPIVFVITHKITTTLIPGSDYEYNYYQVVEGMKKCCEKWSIPYYDAFEESGFCAYNAIQKSNFTINADGCHPNKAGYENYYVPQLIKLFESLLKVNE